MGKQYGTSLLKSAARLPVFSKPANRSARSRQLRAEGRKPIGIRFVENLLDLSY